MIAFNLSKWAGYDSLLDNVSHDDDGDVDHVYVAMEMLGLSHLILPLLIIIFKR